MYEYGTIDGLNPNIIRYPNGKMSVSSVVDNMIAKEQSNQQGQPIQAQQTLANKLSSNLPRTAGMSNRGQTPIYVGEQMQNLAGAGSAGNWVAGITGALNTAQNNNRQVAENDKRNITEIVSSFLGGAGKGLMM